MRNRFILYAALLLLFSKSSVAQTDSLPVFELTSDTAIGIDLNTLYWQILSEVDKQWTIEDVTNRPVSNLFRNSSHVGSNVKRVWIRFRLQNLMDHDAKISLRSGAHYYDVYTRSDTENWRYYRTGDFVPWSERNGFKLNSSVPLIIKPRETIWIYQHLELDLKFRRFGKMGANLLFTERMIQRLYINNESRDSRAVLGSIIFGILLLAAIINFFFFLVVKERVYFFFSLNLLFLGLFFFNYARGDFIFREIPKARLYIGPAIALVTLFLMMNTFRYFLKTSAMYPRWDRWLLTMSFLPLAILGIYIIGNVHLSLVFWITEVCLSVLLVTCFLYTSTKEKYVRIFIAGSLPFYLTAGLWNTAVLISAMNNLPSVVVSILSWVLQWGVRIMYIGAFWQVSLLSWSLFSRYLQLKKQVVLDALEKEKLAREREIERSQLIEQQKIDLEKQVAERTFELKQSLENLKSTQSQLIQSEKMASLGELTAGIAHEIQNPLNFVNNFSEVNKEMLEELRAERLKPNADITLENELINDIIANEEKINHHGKRADIIVKGMLQHSRTSSGQKEPTDINALCDEYLRLSYHGLRAKDKSFNANMKTDFDETIGNINIVPQDIGRVILNLINNAFYAVDEKKKNNEPLAMSYEPTVTVSTKRNNGKVEISVTDNGNGIQQKVLDKIFQPFFTTKPTGQGTGLGLSLAYDIITKGHGGELRVETKEGEGSEFIINLSV